MEELDKNDHRGDGREESLNRGLQRKNVDGFEFRVPVRRSFPWRALFVSCISIFILFYLIFPSHFTRSLVWVKTQIAGASSDSKVLVFDKDDVAPKFRCGRASASKLSDLSCELLLGRHQPILKSFRKDSAGFKLSELSNSAIMMIYVLALVELGNPAELNPVLYRLCSKPANTWACVAREAASNLWSRTAPVRVSKIRLASFGNEVTSFYLYAKGIGYLRSGDLAKAYKSLKMALSRAKTASSAVRYNIISGLVEWAYRSKRQDKLSSFSVSINRELLPYGVSTSIPSALLAVLQRDGERLERALKSHTFDFYYLHNPRVLSYVFFGGLQLGRTAAIKGLLNRVRLIFERAHSGNLSRKVVWKAKGFQTFEARLALAAGQEDNVIATLRRSEHPTDMHLLGVARLLASRSRGDFQKARRLFDLSYQKTNNWQSLYGLTVAELNLGIAKHLKLAMEAVRRSPATKKYKDLYRKRLRVEYLLGRSNFKGAISILEKLTQQWKKTYDVWELYRQALIRSGGKQSAGKVATYLKSAQLRRFEGRLSTHNPLGPLSGPRKNK